MAMKVRVVKDKVLGGYKLVSAVSENFIEAGEAVGITDMTSTHPVYVVRGIRRRLPMTKQVAQRLADRLNKQQP